MTKSSYTRVRRKMEREGAKLEAIRARAAADAEALGPAECRRLLAEWAAQPGRTKEEIDGINAAAGAAIEREG